MPDRTTDISNRAATACDLCGSADSRLVLTSPRLDGPLVRCQRCGLHYVIRPEPAAINDPLPAGQSVTPGTLKKMSEDSGGHAAEEMRRLAARARELELVEPEVEELETHWRKITAAERLADLRRFIGGGKLLEIGCSTGELLAAVPASFRVTGVEADEAASSVARSRDLDCLSGTLFDAEFRDQEFDVVVMYHVIEHLPSPRQTLRELNRILRPGGWLVVETPNIANPWVSVLGARWRQFIPDHLYFFSPETIRKLCGDSGFEIRKLRRVGKSMSVRLFVSRLGRYSKPLARALSVVSHQLHLNDRTLRLNLGDVMRLYAQKQ